ncbi:helix-turn-helix domain-containing protein [Actinomycetospora chibensis]|uniref:Helix-turn-helix domain-containing protein n=1 Tax=Actinomycetospora chibensis TaxID=663606 RepID=A0ABV9RPM8_9PSEU|nr:helix-turn-helix domain-containing protein [Actinomycetospora chibensis]MDD7925387.1 helix-turn-helix domain-containing protein [Actinomycetospora chibensis]
MPAAGHGRTRQPDERDPRELGGHWRTAQRIAVQEPDAELAPWVERLWTASWEYAEPYAQKIVPLPQVHVSLIDEGPPRVVGPRSRHMVRELAGRGSVVGAAFRPGVFGALADGPVSALVDREVEVAEVPALAGEPVLAGAMADWLRAHLPADGPGPAAREARELVARVAADPMIARVDRLAAAAGLGMRSLQRLFSEHVGLGPKWVIRRYRLQEVVDRLETGTRVDWAGLAAELGYADQAHLSRDFADLFGEPPTWYARRYPSS